MISGGIGEHYQGERGKAYAEWQVASHSGLGHVVARKFQPYIADSMTVLDFGCGGGENLANIGCARRLAVEPNPHSAEIARGRGIEVFATLQDAATASVDVLMSHHALEHCLRPFDEISQMRRVLKPDGRLVIVLPIDDWRNQRRFDPDDIHHHLYTWTPLLIGNLLQEAGFEVDESTIVHFVWPPKVHFTANRLPRPVFEALGAIWSHIIRVRELRVVARLSSTF